MAGFAELSARLIPLEHKLAWISSVMEAKQSRDGLEFAEMRTEVNRARMAEKAYEQSLRETLLDQDRLRSEAQQSISAASCSTQATIDDLSRQNQLLQNHLNHECHQLFQEPRSENMAI